MLIINKIIIYLETKQEHPVVWLIVEFLVLSITLQDAAAPLFWQGHSNSLLSISISTLGIDIQTEDTSE